MADLTFLFQEMLNEIQSMSLISAEFLTTETKEIVIGEMVTGLENIRVGRSLTSARWSIEEDQPIKTIDSIGEYEHGDRRGRHKVFGELTFIWDIYCPPEQGPRSRAQRTFILRGKSSTRMRIMERTQAGNQELAMWRVEVGDNASPGCHFHTQIEGHRIEPPYPSSLSVPRFPTILITPMAALEFLLAELFQSRWQKRAVEETADMQRWKPIQKERLMRLFRWQSDAVKNCMGSPWTALKSQKPETDLFTRTP